jgi:hypothetical protein
LPRSIAQKKAVIHRDTWHTNLPPKNVNKSSNSYTPEALTHQLATLVDDFNDHKNKFGPRITRGSLTPETRHTKHGSKKKDVSRYKKSL